MRYAVFATDYDGTLAQHGRVARSTTQALRNLTYTGRRLLLVTGRQLDDLRLAFDELELFDWLVVENGGVLHRPATGETRVLTAPPSPDLVAELKQRGVTPLAVGESIVATWHPNEQIVLDVIRELGLELQVIFNKGAVMVLPAGVTKATGVKQALKELGLSAHNLAAIGDAENDHALLDLAECSAAVANAVPMLRQRADIVMKGDHGAGVEELISSLIDNDLGQFGCVREERMLVLGTRDDGRPVAIQPVGPNLLIAGSSASGKSTVATSLLEQLLSHGYQCCVIDPEGDYGELPEAITLGGAKQAPEASAIASALEHPNTSIVLNLLGVKLADRPQFAAALLLRLQEMRARTGRPHWIVLDEAHHLLPSSWQPATEIMAEGVHSMIFVTVHPEHLAPIVLAKIDVAAAVGEQPLARLEPLAEVLRGSIAQRDAALKSGEALVWFHDSDEAPFKIQVRVSTVERRRHLRKYAEGELGEDRSFYFRGSHGQLNLRAQNLVLFMQIGDGVDDETWQHHLRGGDYSRWIRESIKDEELGADVRSIEDEAERMDPRASRDAIRRAIEARYTLPVSGLAPIAPDRVPKGRPAES